MTISTGMTLYQWEHCPYCAKVRRAFDRMNLEYRTVEVGPEQDEVHELLGHRQVPAMKDERTGVAMLESDDIIQYARHTYVNARHAGEPASA